LPFCHSCIVAPRPPHPHRWKCTQTPPTMPKTIGDHLKAKRLELHLFQSDLARLMGVHMGSIQNWERNVGTPTPGQMPSIIQFLGYVPFEHDGSTLGQIRWLRLCAGWTQQELAAAAGCNEVTVWKWETGQSVDGRVWKCGIKSLCDRLRHLGFRALTADSVPSVESL
jgi:transcriptional regulator with XRE-family HTH domain